MGIYIGTSGWSYEDWVEKFYPEGIEKSEWLKYLTEHFNSVELNMSFYRYPFKNMLKGWRKRMPDDFQMTMKANRRITHYNKFKNIGAALEKFYSLFDLIYENKGCILFQAPPSFKKNEQNKARIENFCNLTNKKYKNVIEFRNPEWWDDEIFNLLEEHKVGFCTVSGLEMPSRVVVTGEIAYFRFHGPAEPYSSLYSAEEMQTWAEKIRQVRSKYDVNDIYCYFNNDTNAYAITNARQLQDYLDFE